MIRPSFDNSRAYIGTLFAVDDHDIDAAEVDPETLGEFTGLTDKNDVKIFEGDIVQQPITLDTATVNFVGGGFVFNYGDEARAMACTFRGVEKHVSIIGNVHDNPELLEVKT